MKILVVDDEQLIRMTLNRTLEKRGHQMFQAENGAKALEILKTETPDLMILDLLMPEKSGFEVLQEMPHQLPVIVISAFSGVAENEIQSETFPQVIGYIRKPFEQLGELLNHIESLYENYIRKV